MGCLSGQVAERWHFKQEKEFRRSRGCEIITQLGEFIAGDDQQDGGKIAIYLDEPRKEG